MNTQLLTSIAIVAAVALVGAVVVATVPIVPQQAFADKPWGCDKDAPNADKCRHKGHKGN